MILSYLSLGSYCTKQNQPFSSLSNNFDALLDTVYVRMLFLSLLIGTMNFVTVIEESLFLGPHRKHRLHVLDPKQSLL